MATGIVSKAMRLDSSATLSAALLSAGIAPGTSPPGSASPATSASSTLPALPVRLGPGASERQPGIMFHRPPVQLCLAQMFQQVHPLAGQVTVGTVEVPVHDHRHGSLPRLAGRRQSGQASGALLRSASGCWRGLSMYTRRSRQPAAVPADARIPRIYGATGVTDHGCLVHCRTGTLQPLRPRCASHPQHFMVALCLRPGARHCRAGSHDDAGCPGRLDRDGAGRL